jgi:2-keto-4-pentenoate hydratase/2-oxohepta-3-ene-1,7-dioic acid hydratase in catechol pathway
LEEVQQQADKISETISINDVELLPPVSNPQKILCIALNYKGHCDEQNKPYPKEPVFFSKYASTLVPPHGNIIAHKISQSIDWEVELAVIIGKEARHVEKSKAFDYVFGYSVAQDISARDWQKQKNGGQFLIGKSMDTFCPLGPCIVHKSAIDPSDLKITCSLNGNLKQSGRTSELIFKIEDIIEQVTKCITLQPGDVILTGTPSGVGMHRNPPEYLKPGDVLESEIENIGKIINKVVQDD